MAKLTIYRGACQTGGCRIDSLAMMSVFEIMWDNFYLMDGFMSPCTPVVTPM